MKGVIEGFGSWLLLSNRAIDLELPCQPRNPSLSVAACFKIFARLLGWKLASLFVQILLAQQEVYRLGFGDECTR